METCTTDSPVESGNRGNAELGACGVRGCTGVGVKKVARDVRFDVMAGRTRTRGRGIQPSSFHSSRGKAGRLGGQEGGRAGGREGAKAGGEGDSPCRPPNRISNGRLSRPCSTLRVRHRVKRIHAWLHRRVYTCSKTRNGCWPWPEGVTLAPPKSTWEQPHPGRSRDLKTWVLEMKPGNCTKPGFSTRFSMLRMDPKSPDSGRA